MDMFSCKSGCSSRGPTGPKRRESLKKLQIYDFLIKQVLNKCFVCFIYSNRLLWYGNSLFDIIEKYIVIAKYLIKYIIYVWRLHKEYTGCSLPGVDLGWWGP